MYAGGGGLIGGGGEVLLNQSPEWSERGEVILANSPCSTELPEGEVAMMPAVGVTTALVGVVSTGVGRD